ncbi:S8 family serine peptidase [Streptomyces sodiiphilus]|uniref:S8 family serine peptidase n=1 Tax=Streptomyces sodiiphilus TaxID=226217 RepID=A0ABN2NWZ7_9ACTN
MRRQGKTTLRAAGAAAVAVTLALGLAPGGSAAGPGPGGPESVTVRPDRSVTLITGDRVLVDQRGEPRGVIRAEGRENIPVRIQHSAEGTHVLPRDAAPLVAAGTLDRRLFDIGELSREEYAQLGGTPLIVTYEEAGGDAPATRAELRAGAGDGPVTALESVNGEALLVADDTAAAAWEALTGPAGDQPFAVAPGIAGVSLDAVLTKSLDASVPQTGAPDLWESGWDGEGVTVAVLDTGVSEKHEDLAGGKVIAAENFSAAEDTEDRDGHGTHVASTIAGTGARSGGTYRGVAPGAGLLSGKVLDDHGSGFESDVIEGMEWAVEQGADIINLSLGAPAGREIDPMEEALNTLAERSGALFVVAAGNAGPRPGSISSPGTADAALTVGAVDKQDALAGFSSVGPRSRDGAVKPDVTAPGVDIGAAAAPGSTLEEHADPVADGYAAASGTSMAAPHAAGAAALLAQAHPGWDGERIKAALTGSAVGGEEYGAFEQGAGRIDVARAVGQTVVAEPVSLSFGTVEWPHEEARPVTRELTYRNLGESDVTLDLTVEGTGPDGGPAPEGMFSLGAERVTVPAGGTATVEAVAGTGPGGEVYGAYSLMVTAEGGGHSVRTAGAVDREPQMHEITVEATARDGSPGGPWSSLLLDLDSMTLHDGPGGPGGSGSVRVPAGTYLLDTAFLVLDGDGLSGLDWLVHPHLEVTGDTVLRVDAADAEPVRMTVEAPEEARQGALAVGFHRLDSRGRAYDVVYLAGGLPDGFGTAELGRAPAEAEPSSFATTTWLADNSEYHAAHVRADGFYTGLELHTEASEMARITTGLGASVPGREGVLFTVPEEARFITGWSRPLPVTMEVYVRAAGTRWAQELRQVDDDWQDEAFYLSDFEELAAGESCTRTFNTGVFGPLLGEGDGLFRDGDTLRGRINTLADGQGHRGGSVYDSAVTTLLRDGEEYASADTPLEGTAFELPPEPAEYELVTTLSRSSVASVSTEVSVSFAFASQSVPEGTPVALPLSVVRFEPGLSLDSTAPAGREQRVPLTVQGPAAGDGLGSLTVRVSYDSGATWEEAAVTDGAVTVRNPAAGGSVSFGAEVTDREGNTTSQTVIDAYLTR